MEILLPLLTGYLFGSILTAELVSRLSTGQSVFSIGTGNPGMANVMAVIGKKEGFLVLAGDILKTGAALAAVWLLFLRGRLSPSSGWPLLEEPALLAGLGVLLGHNWPAWHRFHGGKGVTVTCAWLILALPGWGAAACLAGGAVTLLTGYLPLGAVLIGALGALAGFAAAGPRTGLFFTAAALIMLSRHIHGLKRIAAGTEPRHFRKR